MKKRSGIITVVAFFLIFTLLLAACQSSSDVDDSKGRTDAIINRNSPKPVKPSPTSSNPGTGSGVLEGTWEGWFTLQQFLSHSSDYSEESFFQNYPLRTGLIYSHLDFYGEDRDDLCVFYTYSEDSPGDFHGRDFELEYDDGFMTGYLKEFDVEYYLTLYHSGGDDMLEGTLRISTGDYDLLFSLKLYAEGSKPDIDVLDRPLTLPSPGSSPSTPYPTIYSDDFDPDLLNGVWDGTFILEYATEDLMDLEVGKEYDCTVSVDLSNNSAKVLVAGLENVITDAYAFYDGEKKLTLEAVLCGYPFVMKLTYYRIGDGNIWGWTDIEDSSGYFSIDIDVYK